MARYHKKLAILAKIESSYGTDASPTGGSNAMQMNDVTLTPLDGEEASRDLMLPYMGHQGVILTANIVRLQGKVEIAGAGAAGDVPAWGALLRACGFAETVTASTKVEYTPVSSSFEAASIYFNQDGVNHILLGARGNVQMDFTPKQIPRFQFDFAGLVGTVADTALPTVDLSGFQLPLPVSKAATTLSLHGSSRISESVKFNLGNAVEPRHLIGAESVEITDRQMTGETVVEAQLLAGVNWFSIAQARTRAALALVHGTTAGNIVTVDAPKVEIGRPAQGQSQMITNYTLPLLFCPDEGNDELVITAK